MRLSKAFRAGAVIAALAAGVAAPAMAQASVTATSHFVVEGSNSTTSGDTMFINNGATNDQPNDLLFVTANYDPHGVCPCAYESAPIGVWYSTYDHQWGVFSENGSAMPSTASFNVLAVPKSSTSVFVHRNTASNDIGDFSLINNAGTNNHPNAQIQVTQNWDPGGVGGTYNNHTVGVWYDKSAKKWAIFNEDGATMQAGAAFNVMIGSGASNGGVSVVHYTKSSNQLGDGSTINLPQSNGDPNAVVLATPNWNPGGVGGTYDSVTQGVWYTGSSMAVFNENGSAMQLRSDSNVLVFSS
jgi:hypothetical protein